MLKPVFKSMASLCGWALFLATTGGAAGCASGSVAADVRVPPEVLRGSPYTAGGEPPRSRYVMRVTDGQNDWEVQLPEISTGYEIKVPLSGKPQSPLAVDMAGMTTADREILAQNQAAQRERGVGPDGDPDGTTEDSETSRGATGRPAGRDAPRPGNRPTSAPARGAGTGASASNTPDATKPSYLLTLARVKDLYRTSHYELGLVELVELEKHYPDDEHILSMKGSLYERLGEKSLARDAWQEVLRLNPFNLAVLEALQRLGK